MRHRKISTFLLLFLFCFSQLQAQTDPQLDSYLLNHCHDVEMTTDHSIVFTTGLQDTLIQLMKGKQMFIYGEGWSHGLHLNSSVLNAVIELLETHGLADFFVESPRSWIVEDNIFFHSSAAADSFYPGGPIDFYNDAKERKKLLYNKGHYQTLAIDFERPHSLNETLAIIAGETEASQRASLYKLAPYIKDTSYLSLSPKKFVKFYEEQRTNFFRDSAQFKTVLGDKYGYFKYLMSDPRPSTYADNRNEHMAWHILDQISPIDTGAIYLLDCGMAHSRPGKRDGLQKSVAWMLSESNQLNGKLLIMNLYCDNCSKAGDNQAFDFMKGKILESFKKAANSPIVIYDLTGLPEQYAYIKDNYGGLMVFVRGQNW